MKDREQKKQSLYETLPIVFKTYSDIRTKWTNYSNLNLLLFTNSLKLSQTSGFDVVCYKQEFKHIF